MALKKQILDIPLWGGVETKTDDFDIGTGKLLELSNADLTKKGTVRKRTGYDILSNEKIESANLTINSIHTVDAWEDRLIVIGADGYATQTTVFEGDKVFTYDASEEEWLEAGSLTPIEINVEKITTSSENFGFPTVATGNGYTVFGYNNYNVGIYASSKLAIRVADSMNVVERDASFYVVSNTYVFPQIHYMESEDENTKKFVGWAVDINQNSTINFSRWSWNCDPAVSNVSYNTQEGIFADGKDASMNGLWDSCRIDFADGYHHQALVYKNSSDKIQVRVFDVENQEMCNAEIDQEPAYGLGVRHIKSDDGVGRIFVIWQDVDSLEIYATILNENCVTLIAAASIDDSITGPVGEGDGRMGNVTIARDPQFDVSSSEMTAYTLAYEDQRDSYDLPDGYGTSVRFATIDDDLNNLSNAPATDNYKVHMPFANLQAHAYNHGNKAYFPMGHASTYQATYFISTIQPEKGDDDTLEPRFHAQILHNVGGASRAYQQSNINKKCRRGLSETVLTATDNYMFAGLRQDRLVTDGDVQYSVQAIKINMSPDPLPIVTVGETTTIGGGILQNFDGVTQPLGFPIYPENTGDISIAYGAGTVPTGSFRYKMMYEFFDSKGQLHRSTPSLPITVAVDGSNDATVEILVPWCAWSEWATQYYSGVTLVLYRTTNAGSIYYRITQAALSTNGNHSLLKDTYTDTDIASQETLYTTGGVLENIAPPASNIITARNNRMFLVPMDDRKSIWYSKPKVNTVGLEFAGEFVMRLDDEGDITGLGVMDDKLIVFKERAIYYTYGEGPNSLGQGSFPALKTITSDVGAVNQNSIVSMPLGLMFKSNKGIYLLSRSLQTSYLGSPVESYNSYNVLSADLVEDKNNVIFLLSGGQPALVFDYFHRQWSTYGNHAGKDACIYDGEYTFASTTNRIKQGNPDAFKDGNFTTNLVVKTGWIFPSSAQSYMRVYSFSLLGHFKSHATITVYVYLDYNKTTVVQTFSFDTNTGQSSDEPLQFTGQLSTQKCQSIQFEIRDDNKTGSFESMELSKISLLVGIKEGLYKQPSKKRL